MSKNKPTYTLSDWEEDTRVRGTILHRNGLPVAFFTFSEIGWCLKIKSLLEKLEN